MIPFAIKLKDGAEGQGRWVLAIDGDRFLVVAEDRSFEWVAMAGGLAAGVLANLEKWCGVRR